MKRVRGLLVEQVNVRMTEDIAALLDDYVDALQRRMGDGVIVQRVDAARLILARFLRKRARDGRSRVSKRHSAAR